MPLVRQNLPTRSSANVPTRRYCGLESAETAEWASELLGKYETIQVMETYQGSLANRQRSLNEQQLLKHNVLPSEFFGIDEPSPTTGVEGFFLSPGKSPYRMQIDASEFVDVVVPDEMNHQHAIVRRCDSDQTLIPWSKERRLELGIIREQEPTIDAEQPSPERNPNPLASLRLPIRAAESREQAPSSFA